MQAYCSLTQEQDSLLPSSSLPAEWPSQGAITFQRATLRYRPDLEAVLKEVCFKVEGGMKVGIVGRTGAGKSSLLQALLRLVECDAKGSVFIDGVDASAIPLQTLRGAIAIIP